MAVSDRALQVTQRADAVLRRVNLIGNPYFQSLADGGMTKDEFRRSQEQFFYAVTFFPRPMAALIARIPDPRARLDILHNLVEEHGEFDEQSFHHTTFQQFLHTLGSDPQTIGKQPLWPALRTFNSVLATACVTDEIEVGVSCMGIIEYAFADVSAAIGRAVVERQWIARDDLVHYKLHAEIDKRHAEEFFAIIEPQWNDPSRRYWVDQGLQLGAYIFDRLYRDMLAFARGNDFDGVPQPE